MFIPRYYQNLGEFMQKGKVTLIYGPRRVGKTTLLDHFLGQTVLRYKLDSGDNIRTQDILSSQDFKRILAYVSDYELLVLDEAQQIPNIGMGLKIIVDQRPQMYVVATGSSSFDLAHQVGEPLTGRKWTLMLYPVAQCELRQIFNRYELKEKLPELLLFGSYPEILAAATEAKKIKILNEIVNSYLFKDILTIDRLKSAQPLMDLLKLVALQIGKEVSCSELATQIGLNVRTVQRYLDLLEKTFVLLRVGGLSRNRRKEISKKQKYYFWDTGIRNAVISQFNPLDSRNDVGQLWENFVVVERLKKRAYSDIFASLYFWRTYNQQEVDFVEERDGNLFGYECKWSASRPVKPPRDWQQAYPEAVFTVITPDNYLDHVG